MFQSYHASPIRSVIGLGLGDQLSLKKNPVSILYLHTEFTYPAGQMHDGK